MFKFCGSEIPVRVIKSGARIHSLFLVECVLENFYFIVIIYAFKKKKDRQ